MERLGRYQIWFRFNCFPIRWYMGDGSMARCTAEIAEDIYQCWLAGAAVAHLHMRDEEGKGTMRKERFAETVRLLRENHPDCDIILNFTTSGDLYATDEARQILSLK